MSFLTLSHIQQGYAQQPLFNDFNLSIGEGQLVSLLGPSGCGKSTLLRLVAGLTPLQGGRIHLAGRDISHCAPRERGIGMVFQSYALFPNLSVFDNVAFGLVQQKQPKAQIRQAVEAMLEQVELSELANRLPRQLSGGQCQRVALARALVCKPRLLLLDEPLSALDARIRRHLREQIRQLQQAYGLTTLFVTHDQEEALTLSDHIVLMERGRIVQQGNAAEVYSAPVNEFAACFIGHYNVLSASEAQQLSGHAQTQALAIRPEALLLSTQPQTLAGHCAPQPVQVERLQLLGNVLRYQVRCGGLSLTCDRLNQHPQQVFAVGQQLWLSVPLAALRPLAA